MKFHFPPGQKRTPPPTKVRRLIILSPFKDRVGACFLGKVSSILRVKTWEEVLGLLTGERGERANVAIYPDGTLQYFRSKTCP